MNFLKRGLYKLVEQDSRNMGKVGKFFNWDWLENEADRNTKNPGRAVGKAAGMAASMYLGGLLGGASGAAPAASNAASGAASAAAPAAGSAAMAGLGSGTNMGLAAMTSPAANSYLMAMQQAGALTPEVASAVGGGSGTMMAGTELGAMAPQGFANTMEAGLVDTGYTPSSLANAFKLGPGSGQPMSQTLGNYASNKGASGLLGDFSQGVNRAQKMGLLSGSQQQQQPMPPPPPPQQIQQPVNAGYGGMPPELKGLPPDHPAVMEWKRKQGAGYV